MSTKRPATKASRKAAATKTDNDFQAMTDRFIAMIEDGTADPNKYVMPWNQLGAVVPRNIVSRKRYSGGNHLWLALAAMMADGTPLFATYDQWQTKHCQVRRGETGFVVVRWLELGERNEDGTPKVNPKTGKQSTFMVPKTYKVFGIWQVDDAEGHPGAVARQLARFPMRQRTEVEAVEAADAVWAALGARIVVGGDSAGYAPETDTIHVPDREAFRSGIDHASTMAHEHIHWTGAASRLDRDGVARFDHFGSKQYAAEELVAELGSAFLGNLIGYSTEPRANHAHYLADWLTILRDDNRALHRAASAASKAALWVAERANLDLGDDATAEDDDAAEAGSELLLSAA